MGHLPSGGRVEVTVFRWRGTVITAKPSVFLLLALVLLSLRFRLFPFFYTNPSDAAYWAMAVATTAGIALSVFARELVQVVGARHAGTPPRGFFLDLSDGPSRHPTRRNLGPPSLRAFASTALSLVAGIALLEFTFVAENHARSEALVGVLFHLAAFQFTFAAFQLLPVLPWDGGRFLLSALSPGGKVRLGALKALYGLGLVVGLALVAFGGAQVLWHRPVLGGWIALVGLLGLRRNVEEYRFWHSAAPTVVATFRTVFES